MSIQVSQVRGDVVELIFNPREEDLRVGETLQIRERESGEGLIVQIVAFRMVTYPSLIQEQLGLVMGNNPSRLTSEILSYFADTPDTLPGMLPNETRNLKVAISKIRKLLGHHWDQWDGWIPIRDVDVQRVSDQVLFENCIDDLGNPLHLGQTLRGQPFFIEGHYLEKVNVITGVKGSGKSHLSKVVLLELINAGAPCVVFDINKEYIHLPKHEIDPVTGQVLHKGVVHLKAGENLKLGVRQFGLSPLVTMLTKFGLPEVSAMYFENRMSRLFQEAWQYEQRGQTPPFIGMQHLLSMADDLEFSPSEVVSAAIRSRLEAARNTRVFADHPGEATSMQEEYDKIRHGGALIIDISPLTNLSRQGFVQAIIDIMREICEHEIQQGTGHFPFVFFEEAHLYISRNTIGYIVTRSRHLGITCFFVTNMVGGLDETVLRQVDNLFLLYLPFDDDVRHISKSAMSDQETMVSFVKRLRRHHALILGDVTRQYPVIIRVKELKGIRTAGETQYFFKPKAARAAGVSNTPATATPAAAPVQTTSGKPVSPVEKEPAARKSSPRQAPAATPPASRPSTEEEVAVLKRLQELWQTVVAEVRDKSELLGSVLISGNPARFQDHVVYIGFSSRDSFHRDLLQEPEYRDVVERAISETLKRPVIIACFTTDTRGRPRR